MDNKSNWFKQTPDEPLYPDLLWSRPENNRARGKLLIIGGHSQSFIAPANAYTEALEAGIGTARVLLPSSVQKLLPKASAEMEFAPSTPSGGFGRQALATFLDAADWADAVLLAGDLGKNSETAVLLESFLEKYEGLLAVSQDAVEYFISSNSNYQRPNTLVSANLSQLQKLAIATKSPNAITSQIDFLHFIESLSDLSKSSQLSVIINHLDTTFAASNGQVSSTKPASNRNEVSLAAHAIVWWLQNPNVPFEALTTSLLDSQNKS